MRPIPWILAALVCTAIGVVFTGEGLSSKKPNPLRPSRRGPAAGPSAAAAAAGLVDSATDPAASAMGDVTELPEGFLPPSSAEAELLVPDPGMCVIVVKSADEILFRPPQQPGDLRLSESQIEALEGLVQSMREKQGLPPQEDLRAALLEAARKPVAEWPRPISELDETLVAMRTALASDAADAKLSVLLAFEGHALWSLVRPVLEACGKAGLEEVRFAVLRPNETVGSLTYALFEARTAPSRRRSRPAGTSGARAASCCFGSAASPPSSSTGGRRASAPRSSRTRSPRSTRRTPTSTGRPMPRTARPGRSGPPRRPPSPA
jgi:hypothetical protein